MTYKTEAKTAAASRTEGRRPVDDQDPRAAASVTEAAGETDGGELDAIRRDVTEFARRNPVLFFGGAAALGFLAGRMFKAGDARDARDRTAAARNVPSPYVQTRDYGSQGQI